jgi:hypothetical protein
MNPSLYRVISFTLAVAFAAAGLAFLFFPDATLAFPQRPTEGRSGDNRFFVILAGAYMFLVTALAWSMYRRPAQRIYPLLLCQAKGASALISLAFFVLHQPLPIYLANAIVDGGLSLLVLAMLLKVRE